MQARLQAAQMVARFAAYYMGIKRAEKDSGQAGILCVRICSLKIRTGPRRSEPGAMHMRGADLPKSASAPAAARKLAA